MKVVVVGAGVCGLTAAMLLARDGHEVTVLERDEQPVPDSPEQAWDGWKRGGVAQFRQAHYLTPRGWAWQSSRRRCGDASVEHPCSRRLRQWSWE